MARRYVAPSLLALLPALTAAQQCPIQFDGRVPTNFTAATFDTANGIYNPDNVFGQSTHMSTLLSRQFGTD